MTSELTDAELERYGRHVMLDDIGIAGQQRLKQSHVAVIGAGGLGCPATLYLASSGVGTLTIIDDDVVATSNLQRQILFHDADVGVAKAPVAARELTRLNPHIQIHAVTERANATNLPDLIAGMNLVLDGTDNFTSRHAINAACHDQGIDLISGAAERFDGQVCVFRFSVASRPCYHCLFPNTDAVALEPTPCALLGVYAPLTGLIGSLMAGEAIQVLAQLPGTRLQAHLLAHDMNTQRTKLIAIKPDVACPVCGSD